ncbi:tRNA-uridine aminocarboxypropyltransferase [Myxococcota bacterium]
MTSTTPVRYLSRSDPASGRSPRSVCARCRRPLTACYCRYLTSLPTKTRVVLLQHPRERGRAIGTAHMASLCLPQAELCVGVDWRGSSTVARALSDSASPPILLYPGQGAADIIQHPPVGPVTLVVLDGTWAQTKKVLRLNPQLAHLERYTFNPPVPSQYRVRKEPHCVCVSTIEALAYALGALERNPLDFATLLVPFHAMVSRQMGYCQELHQGRVRHQRSRPVHSDPAFSVLRARAKDLVCVVGEANAWPCRAAGRKTGHDELVHWVAHRMATGEIFDGTAAPSGPLSPSTPTRIGLRPETLAASETIAGLLHRWQGFVRESDVICSWGPYSVSLFMGSGGRVPAARIDLRQVVKNLMKRRLGTMDRLLQTEGAEPAAPLASGRAGLQLGQLSALAHHFARRAR